MFFSFLNKERKDRWVVVVVLGRGLGKGTVTLDVFGSQETERKEAKEDG